MFEIIFGIVGIVGAVISIISLILYVHMTRKIDPNVFMVVSDTLEVMGTHIGNQPHW